LSVAQNAKFCDSIILRIGYERKIEARVRPPQDDQEVAEVTPLRRREGPPLVALPPVRDPLPPEEIWDTSPQVGRVALHHTRGRRAGKRLKVMVAGIRARSASVIRPVPLLIATGACVLMVAVAIITAGTGPSTSPQRLTASALGANHPEHGRTTRPTAASGKAGPHRSQAKTGRRRAAAARKNAVTHSGHKSTRTGSSSAPTKSATVLTTESETPAASAYTSASATATSPGSATTSETKSGPTGSGAAFGPGY
jgi:hypothetical protein